MYILNSSPVLFRVFFFVGHNQSEKQIQSSWIPRAVMGGAALYHQWLWYSGCSRPLHWEIIAILQAHTSVIEISNFFNHKTTHSLMPLWKFFCVVYGNYISWVVKIIDNIKIVLVRKESLLYIVYIKHFENCFISISLTWFSISMIDL